MQIRSRDLIRPKNRGKSLSKKWEQFQLNWYRMRPNENRKGTMLDDNC